MILGKQVAIFNGEWGKISAPREGQKMPWRESNFVDKCWKLKNLSIL